jgi:hypothetical protein
MSTTILDEAEKSVRVQNWYSILENEQNLFETLLASDDTADEVTQSEAAMRVIFALDLDSP